MCFRFFANDVFLGTSTLLGRDPAMGVLLGTFIPRLVIKRCRMHILFYVASNVNGERTLEKG